jgi:tRNA pseudouridine13 synthase
MPDRVPHEPPRTTDQPPVAECVGPAPEDFVVTEIPLYPPTGDGEHWMVELRKRDWTTPDAVSALARAARVAERDIGHAGMKDRHAVTTQWLTIPGRGSAPDTWELPEGLTIVSQTRHSSKIRTGHLAGNRFEIRLLGAVPNGEERARGILDTIVARGLPNYFGTQRFGHGGRNLEDALRWLAAGAPARGKKTRFYRKLYPSVVQAEIFNRYLTARRAHGLDQLLPGEVVRLEGNRSVFVVEDPEAELPRLREGDIHLTGPLPGPKMRAASGAALALERSVVDELALDETSLEMLDRLADGTRRDLVVRPTPLEVRSAEPDALVVTFALPPGSYATQLLRELLPSPWVQGGATEAARSTSRGSAP